ncbi:MAG: DUF2802 domain-containing protein [Halorhodospira halophila]|uniref:DUF2802 domain-containing protein n=1 Tax=Halorhodospira TaxID=85108 RepID=UPI001912A4BF|nr:MULTISPECIES: DUF2802 domain-containing protein [Halorhodospira]MBK5937633.1 hypothetical protein [Halorhodospira halophila]MBK5942436.1 hypothetical protein [Halorhodospira halophila]MCC3750662.1 DUF2802 domain-containing protein [Halorhodospira halophila]MCG5528217.1 DUF2802 domain-containing protein [Halorhodospira halophila]MCG5531986.1 DUF2802 domain-containing protein [Halorhodospira sp. 9621]
MAWLIGVVLAVLAGALVASAYAVYRVQRTLERVQQAEQRMESVETTTRQILEHFRGLSAGAVGQGEHLARLEQNLARLRRRLDQVAAAGGTDGSRFNQAIRMARKGAEAREIADTCEISQVEADLVVLLHGPGRGEGGASG